MRLLIDKQYVDPTLDCLSSQRKLIEKIGQALVLPTRVLNQVNLVASEVIANLVEHGEAKRIDLQMWSSPSGITLRVNDDGSSWDIKSESFTEFDILAESGRGLILVAMSCDRYSIERESNKNCAEFHWSLTDLENKKCVLVIDDDRSQAELLKLYLETEYQVLLAHSATQAKSILQERNVDLIVSDINMPGENGFSLREELIESERFSLTPFVFVSGDLDESLRERASNLAVDDFLLKPVKKNHLLATTRRVLMRTQYLYQAVVKKFNASISASLTEADLPEIPNWSLTCQSRNPGLGGGDCFIILPTPQGARVFIIDVMGHDYTAKFFAYAYTGYIRGFLNASHHTDSLANLLQALNRVAYTDHAFQAVPATILALDLMENGQIEIVSAGHPAPLHLKQSQCSTLEAGGTLLGLIEDVRYESYTFTLEKGERLVPFTDGIFDSSASSEGRIALKQRIQKELVTTQPDSLETAMLKVMSVFDQASDEENMDDSLLMLIELKV